MNKPRIKTTFIGDEAKINVSIPHQGLNIFAWQAKDGHLIIELSNVDEPIEVRAPAVNLRKSTV